MPPSKLLTGPALGLRAREDVPHYRGPSRKCGDYQAASDTLTFAPDETSKMVSVQVNGDRIGEANETFFVVLSNPTNETIADDTGQGTIVDDEPRVRISDFSKAEGKNGLKLCLTSRLHCQLLTMCR